MLCRLGPVMPAILLLAASPALAQPRGEPQPGQHGWLSSLEAGKAQARSSGRPMMVVLRCVP